MRVLVIGGTGFIGRHVVARLAAANHHVLVLTRLYARGVDLQVLPGVTVLQGEPDADATLDALMRGCDAVMNLVGILHGRSGEPYGPEFARAHVALPERIAQACLRNGVHRFIHISALGADPKGPSMYLRSKGDGEAVLRHTFSSWSERGWTIFRPSVVFGADDNFTNLFAQLARRLPVLPLAGADSRMQPVYVKDVAQAIDNALGNPHTWGCTYELAGPQVYTLGEIAAMCARWSGHPRRVIRLPDAIGRLQAGLLACLPGTPLMTPDNLDSLKVDSVAQAPLAAELGLIATPMEAVAPGYLGRHAGKYF